MACRIRALVSSLAHGAAAALARQHRATYSPFPSPSSRPRSTAIFTGHSGFVTCIALWDGNLLTGSRDGTVRSWAIGVGSELNAFRGHEAGVNCLAVAAGSDTDGGTGGVLYSGSYDNTVRSWDVESGEQLQLFKGHTGTVHCVSVCGDRLFSSSADRTARMWRLKSGRCLRVFKGHKDGVKNLHIENNAEGTFLFTASRDGEARCWDVTKPKLPPGAELAGAAAEALAAHASAMGMRKPPVILRGHSEPITSICIEKNVLFTGSLDKTVRAWDWKTGETLRVFRNHSDGVSLVTAYEGLLVSSSFDKSTHLAPCLSVLIDQCSRPIARERALRTAARAVLAAVAAAGSPQDSSFLYPLSLFDPPLVRSLFRLVSAADKRGATDKAKLELMKKYRAFVRHLFATDEEEDDAALTAGRSFAEVDHVDANAKMAKGILRRFNLCPVPELPATHPLVSLQLSSAGLLSLSDVGLQPLHLTSLDFSNNNVDELPRVIGDCVHLTSLICARNRLTVLPSTLRALCKLQFLDLGSNQLSILTPAIEGCTMLRSLNLRGNALRKLPPTMHYLRRLRSLDVSNNQLESLPIEIGGCKSLTTLDLSGNGSRIPFHGSRFISQLPLQCGLLPNLTLLRLKGVHLKGEQARQLAASGSPALLNLLGEQFKGQRQRNLGQLALVGSQGSGKTALWLTMEKFKAKVAVARRLPQLLPDRTHGVRLHESEWLGTKLRVYDFGGTGISAALQPHFCNERCVFIVTWDMSDASTGFATLRKEIANIACIVEHPRIIVVGTHVDLLKDAERQQVAGMEQRVAGVVQEMEMVAALRLLRRSFLQACDMFDKVGRQQVLQSFGAVEQLLACAADGVQLDTPLPTQNSTTPDIESTGAGLWDHELSEHLWKLTDRCLSVVLRLRGLQCSERVLVTLEPLLDKRGQTRGVDRRGSVSWQTKLKSESFPPWLHSVHCISLLEGGGVQAVRDAALDAMNKHPTFGEMVPMSHVVLEEIILANRQRYSPPALSWDQYVSELGVLSGLSDRDKLWSATVDLHRCGVIHFAASGAMGNLVVLDPGWLASALAPMVRYCVANPRGGAVARSALASMWPNKRVYPPHLQVWLERCCENFGLIYIDNSVALEDVAEGAKPGRRMSMFGLATNLSRWRGGAVVQPEEHVRRNRRGSVSDAFVADRELEREQAQNELRRKQDDARKLKRMFKEERTQTADVQVPTLRNTFKIVRKRYNAGNDAETQARKEREEADRQAVLAKARRAHIIAKVMRFYSVCRCRPRTPGRVAATAAAPVVASPGPRNTLGSAVLIARGLGARLANARRSISQYNELAVKSHFVAPALLPENASLVQAWHDEVAFSAMHLRTSNSLSQPASAHASKRYLFPGGLHPGLWTLFLVSLRAFDDLCARDLGLGGKIECCKRAARIVFDGHTALVHTESLESEQGAIVIQVRGTMPANLLCTLERSLFALLDSFPGIIVEEFAGMLGGGGAVDGPNSGDGPNAWVATEQCKAEARDTSSSASTLCSVGAQDSATVCALLSGLPRHVLSSTGATALFLELLSSGACPFDESLLELLAVLLNEGSEPGKVPPETFALLGKMQRDLLHRCVSRLMPGQHPFPIIFCFVPATPADAKSWTNPHQWSKFTFRFLVLAEGMSHYAFLDGLPADADGYNEQGDSNNRDDEGEENDGIFNVSDRGYAVTDPAKLLRSVGPFARHMLASVRAMARAQQLAVRKPRLRRASIGDIKSFEAGVATAADIVGPAIAALYVGGPYERFLFMEVAVKLLEELDAVPDHGESESEAKQETHQPRGKVVHALRALKAFLVRSDPTQTYRLKLVTRHSREALWQPV